MKRDEIEFNINLCDSTLDKLYEEEEKIEELLNIMLIKGIRDDKYKRIKKLQEYNKESQIEIKKILDRLIIMFNYNLTVN